MRRFFLLTFLLCLHACGGGGSSSSTSNNTCLPSVFNASCDLDRDSDGLTDFAEGEFIDSDADGIFDYQESFLLDTDFDGVDDQNDPENIDPCLPSALAAACNPGIATRPVNSSCVATASGPEAAGAITLQRRFASLLFSQPVKMLQAPGSNQHWYVVEQSGTIKVFANEDTASTADTYLSIPVTAGGERGLLGLAFAPGWPAQNELYVSYTFSTSTLPLHSRLSRLIIDDETSLPAAFTEQILLEVDQPFGNHNGGDIAFGNDGLLYYGLGDGGSANDPHNHGQNTTTLLGSMLRIDVDGVPYPSPGYRIPADNPFALNSKCGAAANSQNCPEIYAWGLRNPWRWSFDSHSNNLWVGDVGQGLWEEVDLVVGGGNYGWRCREGANDFNTAGCTSTGLIDPVYEYDHSLGNRSITGGYVYRGSSLSTLAGKYIFADYLSGRIWSLTGSPSTGYQSDELIDSNHLISSFAQDAQGELYITSYVSGEIYQLIDDGGQTGAAPVPADLADTGCVATSDPHLPASGLIPYQPEARFWSDGAEKQRWLALPDNTFINASNDTVWEYPSGTVAMKNFLIEDRLIETRLFMHHQDGAWAGYTYEWDDSETTATRVIGGKIRTLTLAQSTQEWIYPSEDECMQCHTAAAGFLLGLSTPQLNGEYNYPASGVTDNQLETFNHINMFTEDVAEPVSILPFITDPTNLSEPIGARAKAYLHTNCASCHQPGGGAPVNMDLRFETPLGQMNICNITPQLSDLGVPDAKLIAPGDPASSIILNRMNRRDNEAMPPIGSALIDTDGLALLTQWVNQLACN